MTDTRTAAEAAREWLEWTRRHWVLTNESMAERELTSLIISRESAAHARGQEAGARDMRERAAVACDALVVPLVGKLGDKAGRGDGIRDCAAAIRSLPLSEEK